jgi:hypothetical protein
VTIDEEGSQGLIRVSVLEGNKLQGTTKEVKPVALRTRSCLYQLEIDSIRIEKDKGDNGKDKTRNKDREFI